MKLSRTNGLLIVLLLSAVSSAWAFASFQTAKASASLNAESLQVVRQDIDELRTSRGSVALNSDHADLTRHVRTAASAAHVSDQLLSIESGQESPDAGSGSHAPVYLRFNALTLEQLIAFLSDVSAGPDAVAVDLIDLSPPQEPISAAAQTAEHWSAEITLSQTMPSMTSSALSSSTSAAIP